MQLSGPKAIIFVLMWMALRLTGTGISNEPLGAADSIIVGTVIAMDASPVAVRATWTRTLHPNWHICRADVRIERKVDLRSPGAEGTVRSVLWPAVRECSDPIFLNRLLVMPLCQDPDLQWRICGTYQPRTRGPLLALAPHPGRGLSRMERVAYFMLFPGSQVSPEDYEEYLESKDVSELWGILRSPDFSRILALAVGKQDRYRMAASRYLSRWPYGLCSNAGKTKAAFLGPPTDRELERLLDLNEALNQEYPEDLLAMACSDRPAIARRARELLRAKGQGARRIECFPCLSATNQ